MMEADTGMSEDGLFQIVMDECAEALTYACQPPRLTALASSNPGICLSVILAKLTPQQELERAVYACYLAVRKNMVAFNLGPGDPWERAMAIDDWIVCLAQMYALLIRLEEGYAQAERVDLHKIFKRILERYGDEDERR